MVDATELYPEMYIPQMIGHRIVIDSFSTLVIKYGIDNALSSCVSHVMRCASAART